MTTWMRDGEITEVYERAPGEWVAYNRTRRALEVLPDRFRKNAWNEAAAVDYFDDEDEVAEALTEEGWRKRS